MERTSAKIFAIIVVTAGLSWLGVSTMKNITAGSLLTFGTMSIDPSIDPVHELASYNSIADYSIASFYLYPGTLISATGFLLTTRRTMKRDGWLMMSAIMLFLFIPVEIYCLWLDWKIVVLSNGGEWYIKEFREAFLNRYMALGGLPVVAQLCYYTIPIFIILQPLKKKVQ